MKLRSIVAAMLAVTSTAAVAANSAPQPVPVVDTIPPARDVDFPGTIVLKVDATDLGHRLMKVAETIPATAGPMTLLLPEWLPGTHSPEGKLDQLAGLVIQAGGQTLIWKRDPVDVFAFHVDVPAGATQLDVTFDYLSPTAENQGRQVMTPEMLNVEWNAVSLYPAGYFVRRIPVQASVRYPVGWQDATALRPIGPAAADGTVTYQPVNYEVLIDSPVYAGRYMRRDDLGHGITLNTVADEPRLLEAKPEQMALHRNLADQAVKLFGARHFDHYDFLFSLSDGLGGQGLEHHRSSENGVDPGYFTEWDAQVGDRDLLPHEFTHSWDGKFRRPADLWTPDYRVPMRDSLLWVYEGQTQFWGYVLAARSGLWTKDQALDAIGQIAAKLDTLPARSWRSLDDTTNDEIIAHRRPKGWSSWQRSLDYYDEGLLIWLEADAIIRDGTGGKKGMDNFARAFFGSNDGDYGEVTYTFDDVVKTLNRVMPYDWATFLTSRLTDKAKGAPLGGLTRSGYSLTYSDTPSKFDETTAKAAKVLDLYYSLGLTVGKGAKIRSVVWDGPAFKAGLTVEEEIVAVDGRAYDDDVIKKAVKAAKGTTTPIRLIVKSGDRVSEVAISWNGGLRYPHLTKTGKTVTALDKLLTAK